MKAIKVQKLKTITAYTVWFLVPLLITSRSEAKLLGDHICQIEITVPKEVVKWEMKNRTIRTYKWCMNVPPRCSMYSSKLVNESSISIVNVSKSIEACCEGFKEQNNFCVTQCENCQNGLCIKGNCVCQKGWSGPTCQNRITSLAEASTIPTVTIVTDKEFLLLSETTNFPITNYNVTLTVTNSENIEVLYKTTTSNPLLEHLLNIYKTYLSTTERNVAGPIYEDELEGSGLRHKSATNKLNFADDNISSTIKFEESNERIETIKDFEIVDSNFENVNHKISSKDDIDEPLFDRASSKEPSSKIIVTTLPPEIVLTKSNSLQDYAVENAIIKENTEEHYEKHSSVENLSQNIQLNEVANKNLIYSICAASLTTFILLVIAVTLYAVKNSKKNVEKTKQARKVESVAMYRRSIFHSPLPEPPMFDNPTYLATRTSADNENRVEIKDFNVVFQKTIKNPKLDRCQYLYDYPPSTGSYRASSEIDKLSHYNLSQKSLNGIIAEPVYDEIPSKDENLKESVSGQNLGNTTDSITSKSIALYINTCGRTKF